MTTHQSFESVVLSPWKETYEVPPIVIQRCDFRLKVNAALARNHIVVANALVPRGISVDTLLVHVDPGLLEAQDARGRKIHTGVVYKDVS